MKYLAVLGLSLVACVGNGEDAERPTFVELVEATSGIYSVDAFTANFDSCSPGGSGISTANDHGFAVAFQETIAGHRFFTVMSCASPEACRDLVANRDATAIDFAFGLEVVGENGELIGKGATSGVNFGETCEDGQVHDTVLTLAGDRLRIEQGITIADEYPADRDGFCTTDLARKAAANNTCSQMLVLTATFVEAL